MEEAGLITLTEADLRNVRGGTVPAILQYALYFSAAFKAGFYFGYSEVGPALFGQ
jgi:hypothetical protein